MWNWSSWQGYGWLIHICTGFYILCCCAAAGLIPIGCGCRGTSWPSADKSILLLFRPFAPVHAQEAQIRSTAHRVPVLPAALLLLDQYHNIILMLQKEWRPSDSLNKGRYPSTFLEGCRSSQLFWSPDHNSGEFYLIIHSDQLSKAWAITFLILPALLPMKVIPH
jgi:hypothetical protein